MGIFLRQSHNIKPPRWGSPADAQYSIWRNLEDIYGCNHESEVLIMPGFWGFPLLDYSGFNNHGTNHGATYKDGSLDFDGDNDYVDCGNINEAEGISALTSCIWVKTTTEDAGGLIGKDELGMTSEDHTWLLYKTSGSDTATFYVSATAATWDAYIAGTTVIKDGLSHHLCGVYSGVNDLKLFVDGASEGAITGTEPATLRSNAQSVKIGVWNTGTYLNGLTDEVRISNVARTADQTALFHDRPWDLYRRVARPIWSIPAVAELSIPIAQYYYQQQRG